MNPKVETRLNLYHDVEGMWTRDSWLVPEGGTEIWCTGWTRRQTIKPYGDGCHVVVGLTVYHCDELVGILTRQEAEGFTWGIRGVEPLREQKVKGYWKPVKTTESEIVHG